MIKEGSKNQTNYINLTYSLDDYPSYLKYNLEKTFILLDLEIKQLIIKYKSAEALASNINSQNMTLVHKLPNQTEANHTRSAYHNFILSMPSMVQVIQNKSISEIRRDLNDTIINKFDSNIIFDMLQAGRLHGREVSESIEEENEYLTLIVNLCLLFFVLIIIVILQIALIMDRW